jgi:arginase family enzyme
VDRIGVTSQNCLLLSSGRRFQVRVAIVGAPFDEGTSQRPGARYCLRAIRLASWPDNAPLNQYNMDLGIDVSTRFP